MTDNNIDNISRKAFPGKDTSFDPKYWESMESMLDSSRKPGFIFRWKGIGLLSAGALLLTAALGFWINTPADNSANEIHVLTSTIESDKPTNNEQEIPHVSTNESETEVLAKKDEQAKKSSLSKSESNPSKSDPSLPLQIEKEALNKDSFVENQKPNTSTPPVVFEEGLAKAENNTPFNEATEENNQLSLFPSKGIRFPSLKLADIDTNILQPELLTSTSEFGEKIPSGSIVNWFVEGQFNIHQYGKNETQVDNIGYDILTITPQKITDWSVGLTTGFKKGGFYASSGIQMREINQRFGVNYKSTQEEEEIVINERKEISGLDSTFVRHVIQKQQIGSDYVFVLEKTEYNVDTAYSIIQDTTINTTQKESSYAFDQAYQLKYIQVPLTIGYEYILGRKWLIEASIGANFGFLTKSTGNALDQNRLTFYDIKSSNSASKFTLSYSTAVGIGYFIQENLSLRLRPNFQQIVIGPFDEMNFNRKGFGIGAGLRYQF